MALCFEDTLIHNIKTYRQVESCFLVPGYTIADLNNILTEHAERNANIYAENNDIIKNKLRPMYKNDLSQNDANDLFNLAEKLYSFNENLDMGLALEIHEFLVAWAKDKTDTLRTVRSLYYVGLIYQQTNSTISTNKNSEIFLNEALAAFEEGASFRNIYFDIQNKEARLYINKCLGNIYVCTVMRRNINPFSMISAFFEAVDNAKAFWMREDVKSLDPDFPWNLFIENTHHNSTLWIDLIRKSPEMIKEKELYKRVYESALFLKENKKGEQIKRFWTNYRTEYLYLATSHAIGKISNEELLSGLKKLINEADPTDYSNEGFYVMLELPVIYLNYLDIYDPNSKRTINERVLLTNSMIEYSKLSHGKLTDRVLLSTILRCAFEIGFTLDFENYLDFMLSFTSFTHMTSYVHSVQVKKITAALARYFMDMMPDVFIGILGTKTVPAVINNQRAIMRMLEHVALCHDIGKILYTDTISLCSRELNDFEYKIIEEHTQTSTFLKHTSENILCIEDVINCHHKWYDGTQGYPSWADNTKSEFKFVIDMITVADSIEAATDRIGRSYTKPLSLEKVVAEIKAQAGTRYSPIIASALNDSLLLSEIRECITDGMLNTCYDAYLSILEHKNSLFM